MLDERVRLRLEQEEVVTRRAQSLIIRVYQRLTESYLLLLLRRYNLMLTGRFIQSNKSRTLKETVHFTELKGWMFLEVTPATDRFPSTCFLCNTLMSVFFMSKVRSVVLLQTRFYWLGKTPKETLGLSECCVQVKQRCVCLFLFEGIQWV